ncbi:MAG: hypothetical protein ACO1QR_01095, partial [Chthoniobacteraceae bacterium]
YAIGNEPRFPPAMLYAIASAFTNGEPAWTILEGLSRAAAREGKWLMERGKRLLPDVSTTAGS